MTYCLFLDDERLPPENPRNYTSGMSRPWVIARTFVDFKWYILKYGLPDLISFDHDLGMSRSGMDCAWYLVNYCLDKELAPSFEFTVHSANPVGKENIEKLLNNFKKASERIIAESA